MIFGDYPCCGASLTIAVPEVTPQYMPEVCPHCGAKVWHRLSRIDPESWIEDDFLKQYTVDEKTKIVKALSETPATPLHPLLVEIIERMILYGDFRGEVPKGLINTDR